MRGNNELSGVEYENGYAVLYVTDDNVGKIAQYAPEVARVGKQPVVDFSKVGFIPSGVVGQIMGLWDLVKDKELGNLIVRGMTQKQRRVLELAGIHNIADITLEEAVDDITH